MTIHRSAVLLGALCALFCGSSAASPLKEGNRLFKNGRYADALKIYGDGLVDRPQSSVLHFNAGDAAYQMGDFAKADSEFKEASQSALAPLKAAAHYNRGNALFRQQRWADAAEAYKECLRINSKDENAKYNLGIALRMQKSPPAASPPKSGKSGNQNQPKSGQGRGEQPQNESEAKARQGEMSPEDAQRLLEAAGAGELKKSNQKFPKTNAPHPDEDW